MLKKINTRGYPGGEYKWIPTNNGYKYFLYPHVNGMGTSIIISVSMDTCTRYTLI